MNQSAKEKEEHIIREIIGIFTENLNESDKVNELVVVGRDNEI